MGRVIITVDEIIAGRGLISNKETVPPSIEVFVGDGLKYGDDNDLQVNAGPGLGFAAADDPVDPVHIRTIGQRLKVVNTEIAGIGLVPGPGSQIDVDTTPDTSQKQDITVVTATNFQMDGYRLVFATTYTTFIVHRNHAGLVLDIEEGESITELQPLNINGYTLDSSVQETTKTTGLPSFYKS